MRKISIKDLIQEYIIFCRSTAVWPECNTGSKKDIEYLWVGLISEIGELAELLQKNMRDKKEINDYTVLYELGDILYHVILLADTIKNERNFAILNGHDTPINGLDEISLCKRMCIGSLEEIYYAVLAFGHLYGYSLENLIDANREKLSRRICEGKIHGSGSDR